MTPSAARLRAFVRQHTRLVPVPDVPWLRLRLAGDAMAVLRQSALELREPDPPLPFWAFAWPGGLTSTRTPRPPLDSMPEPYDLQVAFRRRDPLAEPPPACDVILAGDVSYEETMARRMFSWFRAALQRGIDVLVGDPGRAHLLTDLERLAVYQVSASREIEGATVNTVAVFTLRAGPHRP